MEPRSVQVNGQSRLSALLEEHEAALLAAWVQEQKNTLQTVGRIKEHELRASCADFLRHFRRVAETDNFADIAGPEWTDLRDLLAEVSHARSDQGYSPSETALFLFSLKKPLFAYLLRDLAAEPDRLAHELLQASAVLDQLGLYTVEMYQKRREELIQRQQQTMLELSTPVVELWEGVVALPLIGALDSERTQIVMESLLQRIVETGAEVAILDITGVPTVDTQVAQHLIKTVTAARLMGTDCVISGIRPQIAQTIVHLGVDLGNITTRASLADALALAFRKAGLTVTRTPPR